MANKCAGDNAIYEDVAFCRGSVSLPGTKEYAFAMRKADIVDYPEKKEIAGMEDAAAYDSNFTLASDAKAIKIDLVPNKSNIKCESQGEYGSKTFKNTSELVLPGTEEKVSGFIAQANNDNMIFIVPTRTGKFRVIGSEAFSAELALGQDSGSASTDANQTTVTVTADDEMPAPFYTGTIPTSEGTFNCATGKVTTGAQA